MINPRFGVEIKVVRFAAVAKEKGKLKGRPSTINREEIMRVVSEENSIAQTASILGVSLSSVQRAKREAKEAELSG